MVFFLLGLSSRWSMLFIFVNAVVAGELGRGETFMFSSSSFYVPLV